MITVLADKYIYKINDFFTDDTGLTLFDPDRPLQTIPEGTQALLIRTVTPINPHTFPDLPDSLTFVGTGSAGTDHVSTEYLGDNGIEFANAAGCNARSVAEYIAVALLLWAEELDKTLSDHTVGIVGIGHTGGEVQKILQALGVQTIAYDPPRGNREKSFQSATIDQLLQSDILTLHVPLTKAGSYPTYQWLDSQKLDNHEFELILNASRGGVIDEHALLEAFNSNTVRNYVLDVWEDEPLFDDRVARRAFIKTPHIAGYSHQAKQRATAMIVQAMQEHFSEHFALPSLEDSTSSSAPSPKTFWSLVDALTYYHPIRDYETRFKMLIGRADNEKAAGFNRIRTGHPLRDEFGYLNIPAHVTDKFPHLNKLIE